MKKIIILIVLFLMTNNAFAWEVNTHRAIDRCALGLPIKSAILNGVGGEYNECNRLNPARNLHWFAENMGINNESYFNIKFDNYVLSDGTSAISYFDYVTKGESKIGISTWNQSFSHYLYLDMIEAGTILEDSLWPGITKNISSSWGNLYDQALGRFNFHFYDAYTMKGLSNIPGKDNSIESHISNSSLVSWGFMDGESLLFSPITNNMETHNNNYNYNSALKYYKKGFGYIETDSIIATKEYKKKYRAKMFVSLGYLLHLINDMSVPAHTRNDAHAPDDFEKWMREGKGKNQEGGFRINGSTLSPNCSKSIKEAIQIVPASKYVNRFQFIVKEAEDTGKHFFSEDSIHLDGTYALLTDLTIPNKDNCEKNYITSIDGKLATCRLKGIFSKKVKYEIMNSKTDDLSVIKDNAKVLIPRAVANAEGFINYFFRGRLKATLIDGNLTIKNISNPDLVVSSDIVTFKDTSYKVYYDTNTSETHFLQECTAPNSLDVNNSFVCDISQKLAEVKSQIGESQKLTVIYDGKIGNEDGVSIAIAKKLTNADLLFSFDKSGSMGSDIENAKNSASDILTDIIGIDNNSTFIEIEAFNGTASVLLSYDSNVTNAKDIISTISSGGGTALYDAIKLAGENAVAHKTSSQVAKSIVILYTDGQENSSVATRDEAIDAISNAKASDIDEVFLIFVGSDTNGEAQLKSIADEAGREFMSVSNASALKDAIEKILKSQ